MVIPVPWDTFKHAHPNRTMGLQNGGNWVHMCALGNWSKVHDVNKCVHHADGVWCFNSTENAPEVPLRSSSTTQRAAKLAALLACGFVAASVLAL
ncbi:hypothetical protein Q8F55_007274 [Vanrija albida]|uniref:Uncharacterized protein n=1 Tax=Vanrija albida TaxID=181172 RepID=A0ABR3Q0C8_9TREE